MNISRWFIITAVLAMVTGVATQRLLSVEKSSDLVMFSEFSVPDLNGTLHNSNEWHGKILIINFWATWCPPCRREIPEFIALQNRYAANNVQFIGIALDDKRDAVSDYVNTVPINYPLLFAGDAGISLARKFGNHLNAVPYTVIVNTHRQIIQQHAGEFSQSQLKVIITPLLH